MQCIARIQIQSRPCHDADIAQRIVSRLHGDIHTRSERFFEGTIAPTCSEHDLAEGLWLVELPPNLSWLLSHGGSLGVAFLFDDQPVLVETELR